MFHLHGTVFWEPQKNKHKTKPNQAPQSHFQVENTRTVPLKPHLRLGPSCNNPANSSSEMLRCQGPPRFSKVAASHWRASLCLRACLLFLLLLLFPSLVLATASSLSFSHRGRLSAASCGQTRRRAFFKTRRNRSVSLTRPAGGRGYECNLCIPPPRRL